MPLQEVVTNLMPGEAVTVVGPGVLEFQQLPTAAAMAKAAGGGAAVGKGAAIGAAGAAGTGAVVTAGGITPAAQSVPASIGSGKVLGINLATWNPWVLLAVGAFGGYLYYRQKNSGLGRFWPV